MFTKSNRGLASICKSHRNFFFSYLARAQRQPVSVNPVKVQPRRHYRFTKKLQDTHREKPASYLAFLSPKFKNIYKNISLTKMFTTVDIQEVQGTYENLTFYYK